MEKPVRRTQTVEDVKRTLELCKKTKADEAMARAMLKHGNLADDARAWVAANYPQRERT